MDDVQIGFAGMPGFLKGEEGPDLPLEARAIGATVDGRPGLEPLRAQRARARRSAPDYKLDWLAALAGDAQDWIAADPDRPIALIGRLQRGAAGLG